MPDGCIQGMTCWGRGVASRNAGCTMVGGLRGSAMREASDADLEIIDGRLDSSLDRSLALDKLRDVRSLGAASRPIDELRMRLKLTLSDELLGRDSTMAEPGLDMRCASSMSSALMPRRSF